VTSTYRPWQSTLPDTSDAVPWLRLLALTPGIAAPQRRQTVWCTADCRRSKAASPASQDHNCGTPLAGTPHRDTRAYSRKKDLVRVVSCDRKRSDALDRKRRKQFFLLSLQDHDPNLGISKHTPHPSARPESRKAIGILQSLLLPRHSSIMPFSPGVSVAVGPLPGGIGRGVQGSKSAFFTHTIPR
jgi:hypothetical protein